MSLTFLTASLTLFGEETKISVVAINLQNYANLLTLSANFKKESAPEAEEVAYKVSEKSSDAT